MLAKLVINQNSRRGVERAEIVRSALRGCGIEFFEETIANGRSISPDCIVAAGGDGTVAGCIGEAVASELPIGIVPLGTFNELARTLDIPLDIESACALIAGRTMRTIDVGRVNGVFFVNESSIGISSRITRLQTPEIKRRYGILGVIGTALQAYRHVRPFRVRVLHDGLSEEFKTVQLTIANSHRFGGFLSDAEAAIDDNRLNLYSVQIDNIFEALSVVRAMLARDRSNVPGLRTLTSRSFEVRTRRRHRIVADGEPAGCTPAVFEVLPRALRVFAKSIADAV